MIYDDMIYISNRFYICPNKCTLSFSIKWHWLSRSMPKHELSLILAYQTYQGDQKEDKN